MTLAATRKNNRNHSAAPWYWSSKIAKSAPATVASTATTVVIRRPKTIAAPRGASRNAVTGYSRGAVTIAPMAAIASMMATAIVAGLLALRRSIRQRYRPEESPARTGRARRGRRTQGRHGARFGLD